MITAVLTVFLLLVGRLWATRPARWALLQLWRIPVLRPGLEVVNRCLNLLVRAASGARRTLTAVRRHPALVVVVVAFMAAVYVLVPPLLRVPVVLVVLYVVGRFWKPRDRVKGWWSHAALVGAMTTAGILPRLKEGEPALTLSYRGAVESGAHGVTACVELPLGRNLSDVLRHREALAAAMRVPPSRLEVTRHDDDPGGVVRIHVSNGVTGETASTVATADQTNWSDPIRIGRNTRGEPVTLATFEHNSLVAGRPGSGKTTTVKLLLAHYLLDPSTSIYLLDGKGSLSDYGACRTMCTRYVSGTSEDAVSDTLDMLTTVLDLVRTRNATGGEHAGALVLLEELQDVRAGADKAQRDQLDATLGRIVRMGRAVAVHVLISTQRPTADDLPAGVRNLLSQRVALMLRNAADAGLVLGAAPTIALPERRGQALVTDGGPVQAVTLDRLDDAAWKAVCGRARATRPLVPAWTPRPETAPAAPAAPVAPPRAAEPRTPAPEPAPAPDPVDPLIDAVLTVLADADPNGITATELHGRLPEWTQAVCPTVRSLGVELARHGGKVERVNRGQNRVWRLTEQARTSAGPVPGECRASAAPTDGGTRNGPNSRSHGPSGTSAGGQP